MRNPPDPDTFNRIVWSIARQIPAGRVSTYGQIASMIPEPPGVLPPEFHRWSAPWVGGAMTAVPGDQDIPWQRVITRQGKISLPVGSPGAREQRALLESEGVIFDDSGRVDFNIVGWEGPDQDWLKQNSLLPPKSLRKDTGDAQQLSLF